jgi:hypothetical protein
MTRYRYLDDGSNKEINMTDPISPEPIEQPDGSIFNKMPNCPFPACYVQSKHGVSDRAKQCEQLHVSVYGLFCKTGNPDKRPG